MVGNKALAHSKIGSQHLSCGGTTCIYVSCLEQQSLRSPCMQVAQLLHKNTKSRIAFPNQSTGHHLCCHKLLIPCLPIDRLLQPGSLGICLQHSLQSTAHAATKLVTHPAHIFIQPKGKPMWYVVAFIVSCACSKQLLAAPAATMEMCL